MVIRPTLPFINYLSRDWDTIRQAIFDHLRRRFPEDWTDFTESNIGVALIEAVAYMFEVLSYSIDRSVNENFLATAQERSSVAKLAALVGYKLSPATASSVLIQADSTALNKLQSPIFISAATSVLAGDVVFEVDTDYTIVLTDGLWVTNGGPALTYAIIGATQGRTVTENYISDGSKYQTFTVGESSYITASCRILVDGVLWSEVDSLVIGQPDIPSNNNIYETSVDSIDRLTIKFGDGVAGNIPNKDAQIRIIYRIGGGSVGNIASRSIDTDIPCTANGVAAKLKVYNPLSASGGADRESIERAKLFAPIWGRTTDRAITETDFIALANGYSDGANGRIAKAGIVVGPSDGLSNVVTIYGWTEDGQGDLTIVPQPLKTSLKQFLDSRRILTVFLSDIQDGINVPINLDLLVSAYSGFDRADLERRILIVLKSLFSSIQVRVNNQLRMSWVHDYLLSVAGVRSVAIRGPNPRTETFTVTHIENGNLPSQATAPEQNKIAITVSADRASNFYVGYDVAINYGTGAQNNYRVISSTSATSGNISILTINKSVTSATQGTAYAITHPRKTRLSTTPSSSDITNRRLVFPQAVGGLTDVEKSIVDYEPIERIVTLDRDFKSSPVIGSTILLTPDFYVNSIRAITLGNVDIEIEDRF